MFRNDGFGSIGADTAMVLTRSACALVLSAVPVNLGQRSAKLSRLACVRFGLAAR
jgi:hypothetical protein